MHLVSPHLMLDGARSPDLPHVKCRLIDQDQVQRTLQVPRTQALRVRCSWICRLANHHPFEERCTW